MLLSVGYCRVPLVPRDGARVVRGRGDRGADERALRQHQGRPRGAARRRHDLHERSCAHRRQRRLAADRVPHARGRPFFGGTYFPRSRATGMPGFRHGPARARRGVPRAAARGRREGGASSATRHRPRLAGAGGPRPDRARSCCGAPSRKLVARFDRAQRAASAAAPKFPARMALELLLRRGALERRRGRRRVDAVTLAAMARAGCTISSAAASIATRSTSAGSCRTSRRCSTTTRCSLRRTCTRWELTGAER